MAKSRLSSSDLIRVFWGYVIGAGVALALLSLPGTFSKERFQSDPFRPAPDFQSGSSVASSSHTARLSPVARMAGNRIGPVRCGANEPLTACDERRS
ncbi:hypothetical protein [Roseibium sp. RKSG952]|uniref:hypothetical protein n=1 Tax=Roseibium sp. RKSG952 TaxID=2529384 RepID=UPI0012BC216B|nr:hypothetical protein [Roseibium sp. RKSG952]MTH99849.1 hypothetical protein [Roseibium sp. RKSG952]